MPEPSTLYDEKRTLIEKYETAVARVKDLEDRLTQIHTFIHELTADQYIESDYPLKIVKEIIYGPARPSTQTITDTQTGLHSNPGS